MPVPTGDEGIISDPDVPFFPDDLTEMVPSTSSGPEPSSATQPAQAGAAVPTPPVGTDTADMPATNGEAAEEVPEFDPRCRNDFEGLLYIGALTDEFVWGGHKFQIKTLTVNDYLEVGLIHQRFKDSIGDVRAYTTAVAAACIVTVDGQRLPLPITNDVQQVQLGYRFTYVSEHWFPWVVDVVYERFQLLEARVERAIEAMGKASG